MGHSDGHIYGYMRIPCRVEVNARLEQPAIPAQERKLG
jgi:hypothetical protein